MSCPRPPIPCPRSAAASARKTGCARATASSSNPATARSPSAPSNATSPDKAWEMGWVKPLKPGRDRGLSVRRHRRRPGRTGGGRATARDGLRRHRLRPSRPRRRPADLPASPASSWRRRWCGGARPAWRTAASPWSRASRSAARRPWRRCAKGTTALLIATGVYKARDLPCPGNRVGPGSCQRWTI